MVLSCSTVGIHVILIPNSPSDLLPRQCQVGLAAMAAEIALQSGCLFKNLHVCTDHLHMLFVSGDEHAVNTFLPEFADKSAELIQTVRESGPFAWQERIHVTLLPPWHVEILASFVRDQDNYHKNRTLQQELDEIFLPNAALYVETGDEPLGPPPAYN